MTELTYISDFISGNMEAFGKIYNLYVGRAYSYIFTMTKDHELSQDITHNLFLQLWNSRANINISDNIEGYIFTIARNLVYREIRSRIIQDNYSATITHSEETDMHIEDKINYDIIEKHIMNLLDTLPQSRRDIFIMRWREGLSNKEIAERLNISEKTVSTQIHRAVQYLKTKVGMSFVAVCAILSIEI